MLSVQRHRQFCLNVARETICAVIFRRIPFESINKKWHRQHSKCPMFFRLCGPLRARVSPTVVVLSRAKWSPWRPTPDWWRDTKSLHHSIIIISISSASHMPNHQLVNCVSRSVVLGIWRNLGSNITIRFRIHNHSNQTEKMNSLIPIFIETLRWPAKMICSCNGQPELKIVYICRYSRATSNQLNWNQWWFGFTADHSFWARIRKCCPIRSICCGKMLSFFQLIIELGHTVSGIVHRLWNTHTEPIFVFAGFLSLSDPELDIPGNAGLKDQCLALKWIKANCADFGGDPENISELSYGKMGQWILRLNRLLCFFFTFKAVFGDSAGGASIHFHMVSEMSKDLFHKAIIMSGTVYAPWALSPVKDWTQRLSKKLGWNGEGDDKACLAVILNASAESVTKAQDNLLTPEVSLERFWLVAPGLAFILLFSFLGSG